MIESKALVQALLDRGVRRASGVPCGHLRDVIAELTLAGRYITAANEGLALSMAAGSELVGVRSVVLIQNSGFGNLLNPLSSVLIPAQIPSLIVVSMRGWPDPQADEPEHAVMGTGTESILKSLNVGYGIVRKGDSLARLVTLLDIADEAYKSRQPWFLLIEPGTLTDADSQRNPTPNGSDEPSNQYDNLDRPAALTTISRFLDATLVFATVGYVSRDLFAIMDRAENMYAQGGMGHALALGIGAAADGHRVVVLDGDGAALMHLGSAAGAGCLPSIQLTHVIFDNGVYESTGCQPTPSLRLRWNSLADGLGYNSCEVVSTRDDLERVMATAVSRDGLHMVVVKITPHKGEVPPRPSSTLSLADLTERFMACFRISNTAAIRFPRLFD